VLDDAVLIDCDLRGADLSIAKLGALATLRGLRLERCDLRASSWRGRELDGVTLIGCKLFGLIGGPSMNGATIVRPDFSPDGNGAMFGIEQATGSRWCRR
jgi:uncharacterized protein YjbI with pentapeptide repeats